MLKVAITITHNGEPAEGAKVILGDPFNRKWILGPKGEISRKLAEGFATVLPYEVRMRDAEGKETLAAGGSITIDVSEQTEYEIEV